MSSHQAARASQLPHPAPQTFRTTEVARILGTTTAGVRSLVRAGLCPPASRDREMKLAFQDLVLLRAALGLLQADVPPRRVRRALSELAKQLPPERPLSGVRIYADGRHVVARDGRAAWRPESGQVVFTFEVDELARKAGVVVPVQSKHTRRATQKADPLQQAEIWFERGLTHEQQHDVESACAAYRSALEFDPQLSDAYINLGRLVHEQGKVSEAARLYHLALECEPDDPIAHYNLALALEDERHPSAAVAHYECAVRIDPDFADAHFNLGRLLERLGNRTQAMRHLVTYKKLTDG